MNMDMDEKIYSLMAQAEYIQGHAVKLQRGADEALERLPEAVRDAMSRISRDSMITHIQRLTLAALVIGTVICFGLVSFVKYQTSKLEDLTSRAETMQKTVDRLSDQYGKAKFSTCNGRPCIRVNERFGKFGETKDGELYMVIYGY